MLFFTITDHATIAKLFGCIILLKGGFHEDDNITSLEVGRPATRWEFSDAGPSKYDAPDLNATGNEITIENMEIVNAGMRRVK